MVTEISLYLPNEPGQLAKVLRNLKEINIYAFNIEYPGEYPYTRVRIICNKVDEAIHKLRKAAYSFSTGQVFAIGSSHTPGQLLKMAELFGEHGINIESGYLAIASGQARAINILGVKKGSCEKAKKLLMENGFEDYDEIPEN